MEFLEQEHISPALLDGVRAYRAQYPAEPALQGRIPQPRYHYYGKEVWEAAIAALLCGENLLLAGSKATGKNVLAENLAQAFGRPAWDVSFHVSVSPRPPPRSSTPTADGASAGPVRSCAERRTPARQRLHTRFPFHKPARLPCRSRGALLFVIAYIAGRRLHRRL